ncbi:M48 family metallopeptidase [Streptomyces sp. NPDC096205]|uniref:M48 family metallopeptidase n=1 Tax=Streptomyces sp. NPDC096205 TaxID=3366081 RepID=UPI003830F87C
MALASRQSQTAFALVDEVAAAVGPWGVDAVVVDGEINAAVCGLGLRGRMLVLGVPLWSVLSPQERVALLGHELGHFVNGDTRHGLVVGSAHRSLALWHHFFAPALRGSDNWLHMLINLAVIPFRLLVGALLAVFDLLAVRATQRGEYLADSVAARAGSTEAAVGLMDRLLVADSVEVNLRREINARRIGAPAGRAASKSGEGLWDELAARVAEIPAYEHERRRRVGDSVVADADRELRIAAELAESSARVAREVIRDAEY